jgi:hypothetical protein
LQMIFFIVASAVYGSGEEDPKPGIRRCGTQCR